VHDGTGARPVWGHRQNSMKALRAARRPPPASGGWLGLFGGQWQCGAPWNRSGARPNRAAFCFACSRPCPQRSGMVEQGRGLCGGIVRILRKLFEPPGDHRRPPEGGSASLEARGGVVPHGIRAVPDGIRSRSALPARARAHRGQARWNRAAACAGALLEFCESSSSRREAAAGLRRVAWPLRRSGTAWCLWNSSSARQNRVALCFARSHPCRARSGWAR